MCRELEESQPGQVPVQAPALAAVAVLLDGLAETWPPALCGGPCRSQRPDKGGERGDLPV